MLYRLLFLLLRPVFILPRPAYAQDASAFVVTSPNATSVINYASGVRFNITWHSNSTAAVNLYLYAGYDKNLTQLYTIACKLDNHDVQIVRESMANMLMLKTIANVDNIGYYQWNPYITLDSRTPSGCNYTVQAFDGTSRVFSRYFTINNGENGGLPLDSVCGTIGLYNLTVIVKRPDTDSV